MEDEALQKKRLMDLNTQQQKLRAVKHRKKKINEKKRASVSFSRSSIGLTYV